MIAFFGIALLLGPPAIFVSGLKPDDPQCLHKQQLIWEGKPYYQYPSPVEAKNFDKTVTLVRLPTDKDKKERSFVASVENDNEVLPSVNVLDTEYELLRIDAVLLNGPATVTFQVTFINVDDNKQQRYISIVLPMLTAHNADSDRQLVDKTVYDLAKLAEDGATSVSLRWVQPLLDQVAQIDNAGTIVGPLHRYPDDKVFMTRCQKADYLSLMMFVTA